MKSSSLTMWSVVAVMIGLVSAAPIPDPQGSTAKTLSLPDGQLHYVVLGSRGTPLIAVNGGPGFDHTIMTTSRAWSILAQTRRIVFYDQRGTGQSHSTRYMSSLTVDVLVQDLDRLRQHLGVEKMDLAGWSWGGYLVMAYAVQHPEHVAHLLLIDPAPPKLEDNIYLFDKIFPEIADRQKPNNTPAGKVGCESERIDDYIYMEFYDPVKRDEALKAGPYPFSEPMCTAAMVEAMKHDLTGAMHRLHVPTLVLSGRFDANVAPSQSFKLSKWIPNAQFHAFERSGHMPFVEQPEEFAAVVQAFLGQTP
jgi:proline iminopeptidase